MRRLAAVETLGSTTVICSDKTGTLTQNRMTATCAYIIPAGLSPLNGNTSPDLDLLLRGLALNTDASISSEGSQTGDPTEVALLRASMNYGIDRVTAEASWPREQEIPFDSQRKRMTTVHRTPEGGYIQWTKGAPEILVDLCDRAHPGVPLDDRTREAALEAARTLARDALRVVAVAYRELPACVPCEDDMVFLGLVGLQDPPRPGARDSVTMTHRAGIIPVMITGDHLDTAVAIARHLGILEDGKHAITGRELEATDDSQLALTAKETRVYARVSPEHKVRIVDALKSLGHVVAMTGDGVNDAPALKRADVGVAMGKDGTDVAREAADMVLADDDYSTIVAAVEEGRIIFSNIRKFVTYLLSTNLGEVFAVLGTVLAGYPLPLRPAQLLWLNLVTDSFPALALGLERSAVGVMNRPPRSPSERILTRRRWMRVMVQGLVIALVPVAGLLYGLPRGLDAARTIAFASLSIAEILRAFTARSEEVPLWRLPLSANPYMVPAAIISLLLVLVPIYVEPIATAFRAVPLNLNDWSVVLGLALVPSIGAEIQKILASLTVGMTDRKHL